jgi:protein-arginine kinase activator protein McsA
MKIKICHLCEAEESTLFRIQIQKGKIWIFVCKSCCEKSQKLADYKYGGTWKGKQNYC